MNCTSKMHVDCRNSIAAAAVHHVHGVGIFSRAQVRGTTNGIPRGYTFGFTA